jgi:hypothetical protein
MRIPRTRQSPTAPPLLASFAAYTLGMVAMVVWVARDDSPWILALAAVVLLGLVAMLLRTLRRLLGGGESPLADGRPIRRRTFLLTGLPAVIVPLLAA